MTKQYKKLKFWISFLFLSLPFPYLTFFFSIRLSRSLPFISLLFDISKALFFQNESRCFSNPAPSSPGQFFFQASPFGSFSRMKETFLRDNIYHRKRSPLFSFFLSSLFRAAKAASSCTTYESIFSGSSSSADWLYFQEGYFFFLYMRHLSPPSCPPDVCGRYSFVRLVKKRGHFQITRILF